MDDAEMGKQTSDRMKGVFAGLRKVFDALWPQGHAVRAGQGDRARHHLDGDATAILRGHNSFIIASGNGKVFVQADVTHTPLFVRNPGWHLMFDQDANMAEATRRKVYDMLAAEKMMVQGFHYPFPARAYIEKTATGYRETMVPWNPTL